VVGLGSGSTALYFIRILGSRLETGDLHEIKGIPTSHQSSEAAIEAGIPLTSIDEHPILDLSVDGADQIDMQLRAIKGGGGALLREKVVAAASNTYVIIADERKVTEHLGEGYSLPIEVFPFSRRAVLKEIEGLGAKVTIREAKGKLGPVVTDNGNIIFDADFGWIQDPHNLEKTLKLIPGVLETGLFLDYADLAYIGTKEGVNKLERGC